MPKLLTIVQGAKIESQNNRGGVNLTPLFKASRVKELLAILSFHYHTFLRLVERKNIPY